MKWTPRDKLIPIRPGEYVKVQDKTMKAPVVAQIIAVYKRTAKIKFANGTKKVIHRKYILEKIE